MLEYIIHILHVVIQAEACVDLLVAQVCGNAFGQLEILLHLAAFHQCLHSYWLHEVVCLLAHKALLDERVNHALCEDCAVGLTDIVEHVLWIYHEVVQNTLKASEHVIKQHGSIWQYDTLGR